MPVEAGPEGVEVDHKVDKTIGILEPTAPVGLPIPIMMLRSLLRYPAQEVIPLQR